MEIINWRLIGNPINWVTVILMVMIATFLFHLLEQQFSPMVAAD